MESARNPLYEMFPAMEESIIDAVFAERGNDMDLTVATLLEMSDSSSIPFHQQSNPNPNELIRSDAKLAKKIANEEHDLQINHMLLKLGMGPEADYKLRKKNIKEDEKLAMKLHAEEHGEVCDDEQERKKTFSPKQRARKNQTLVSLGIYKLTPLVEKIRGKSDRQVDDNGENLPLTCLMD